MNDIMSVMGDYDCGVGVIALSCGMFVCLVLSWILNLNWLTSGLKVKLFKINALEKGR